MSLRSPWMRFFELEPIASVSVAAGLVPEEGRPREV